MPSCQPDHAREQNRCRADCYIDFRPHPHDAQQHCRRHLQHSWHTCCQGHPVMLLRNVLCSGVYRLYHSADASRDMWC